MTNIAKGLLAGLAATVALSLLMLMKGAMGLMPALDPIGMIAMMPMAGAGIFGMQLGMMAPVMTLVMHIVFGAVLGGVYSMLLRRGSVTSTL